MMLTFQQVNGDHSHDSELVCEIARVFCSAREERLKFLLDLRNIEEDCRFLSEVVLRDNCVWIAEVDGKIAGFIAFQKGWVNHLYIDPPFQRQGIGRKLLEIAKRSSDALKLWVFEINSPAIAFYEKEGFRIIERTRGARNEARMPDVCMMWEESGRE